jgi:predicted DNA binding protein
MSTLAEFTIERGAFPFDRLFESLPEATVEIERIIPTGDAILPYVWIEGCDGARARDLLAGSPNLTTVEVIDVVGDRTLLRCKYVEAYEGVLGAIVHTGVTLLSADGSADGWKIQVRGLEQGDISAFDQFCRSNDIPLKLIALHDLSATDGPYAQELTGPQREALLLAFEMGYFDEPRTSTLEDVAAELGISRQALAKRLRRGHRRLIERL